MLTVVVGHSDDPDSHFAIAEVLDQCQNQLATSQPKAGILFAGIDFEHTLILARIYQIFPDIVLIGGTTDGELSSRLGYQQDSLTLMLFCADEIEITAGIGRGVSKNPNSAAAEAVDQAKANITKQPRLCLTVPESLTASGVAILQGLKQALGLEIPIFGGTCGDQLQLQKTYQFFNQEVTSDAVPILIFSGDLLFSHGIASGWCPTGNPGKVTKSDKNVLYEIDGKPALDFHRSYFGELPPAVFLPFAVFEQDEDNFYIRATNGTYDSDIGSISFFADIPENTYIQMTEATREQILTAAQTSILKALKSYPGNTPTAALFFSCSARRQILGVQAKQEYLRLKQNIPQSLVCCGFYTYGEIAPIQINGETRFHNETFVTLLLGER